MKCQKLYLLLFTAFVFIGCDEYTSKYPIGIAEDSYLKKELLNEWRYVPNEKDENSFNPHSLQIMSINNKEYLLRFVPDTIESIDDVLLSIGYITKIGDKEYANTRFLSVNPEESMNEKFAIHKFQAVSDTLFFWGISKKEFEKKKLNITSIKEHQDFIRLRQDVSWDLKYTYVRESE